MTEAYIGIDPGKSGGIACFYNDDDVVRVSKCPDTPEGMYTIYGILICFDVYSILIFFYV